MSMDRLKSLYYGLYGENGITKFFYDQLVSIMETAKENKSETIPNHCEQKVGEALGTGMWKQGLPYREKFVRKKRS